jgi:hypothetical protein
MLPVGPELLEMKREADEVLEFTQSPDDAGSTKGESNKHCPGRLKFSSPPCSAFFPLHILPSCLSIFYFPWCPYLFNRSRRRSHFQWHILQNQPRTVTTIKWLHRRNSLARQQGWTNISGRQETLAPVLARIFSPRLAVQIQFLTARLAICSLEYQTAELDGLYHLRKHSC